jgi:alanine racemase
MRPTKVVINLSAFKQNVIQIQNNLKKDTGLMAIVKANAYGHGASVISREALSLGVNWLGVAIPEEGAELRNKGIKAPILVLGPIDETQMQTVIEYNLTQTIFSPSTARMLNHQAKLQDKCVSIHLKIDTGMGRIGIQTQSELLNMIEVINQLHNLKLEGVFTHYATSDEKDKAFILSQLKRFNEFLDILSKYKMNIKWIHSANSGAIIRYPDTHFNLVRAGISLYGYFPSDDIVDYKLNLQPILEWKTRVAYIKKIPIGSSVSYGRDFVAQVPTTVATLPIGYADGYNRLLSCKGWVLIHGQRAPIIGRVCMDQTMVDVSHIPDVRTGDTVTLIGKQGAQSITADDLARLCGTISYEILTAIAARVPRVYIRENI